MPLPSQILKIYYLEFIAKTVFGLEELLAAELQSIGAEQVEPWTRAVRFDGDQKTLYRANYELFTPLRILKPIHRFRCRDEEELYRNIYRMDWSAYLNPDQTLAIDAVCNSSRFRHSKYIALKTKDAVVDQFRARFRRRPSVDLQNPTLRIHIHIREEDCTVALDSSGRSLHKRGYKVASVPAPINEVLAAGILKLAGWPKEVPFLDPMCGSGTFPLEAAMLAMHWPAQRCNPNFGFQHWPDFDAALWKEVMEAAEEKILPKWDFPIIGRDLDATAIRAARQNAAKLGVRQQVSFEKGDFIDGPPTDEDTFLVMNPPYDERLSQENVEYFYKCIGDQLKQHCIGSTAWIISSNSSAMKSVGLRPSRKITLYNGPLECRLFKYELYAGTKKVHKQTNPG